MITPRMVRIDGVNTPAKAPNFLACDIATRDLFFVKIRINLKSKGNGGREEWKNGRMEWWSIGVLECWSVGVLECWNNG
jgi:hypothetical protein